MVVDAKWGDCLDEQRARPRCSITTITAPADWLVNLLEVMFDRLRKDATANEYISIGLIYKRYPSIANEYIGRARANLLEESLSSAACAEVF